MSLAAILRPRRRRLSLFAFASLLIILVFTGRLWRDRQSALHEQMEMENRFLGICVDVARTLIDSFEPLEGSEPWQRTEDNDIIIYQYSAVLHNHDLGRRSVQEVKVVAVGSDPQLFTPYCQLWYPEELHPRFDKATVMSKGPPLAESASSSEQLYQYVFTCSLSIVDPLPTHVSIVTGACYDPETFLEIYKPSMAGITHEFGVCVPASVGDWDPVHIVEWIEVQRMLGVTDFQIYNTNLTSETISHLHHYTDKGIVKIIPIPVLKLELESDSGSYVYTNKELLDTVSLTDCLLKNMYRIRNLIVTDFNDIIVPSKDNSYKDMLHRISQDLGTFGDVPDSFGFHGANFGSNCEARNKGKSIFFKYFKRSEASSTKVETPFMLNPIKCMSLSRDGCKGSGRSALTFAWDVKPEVAIAHHYKSPEGDVCDDNAKENGGVVKDEVLAKFRYRILPVSPIGLDGWLNL